MVTTGNIANGVNGQVNQKANDDRVRIKGANSDYRFDVGSGHIVENKGADPLYLKIFICPNKMPSRIEPPHKGKWCEGTDAECPEPQKPGHALICLHQTQGISLETANAVTVKSSFQVQPDGKDPVLHITEAERTLVAPVVVNTSAKKRLLEVTDTAFTVTAPVVLRSQEKGVQISVSDQEIVLRTPEGAIVQLKGNTIEITPGKTGTVKINGNLEVTGEVTAAGKKLSGS